MSSKPWFKFFPGDYLGDTRRLSQTEHGAYFLLMLDYYSTGTAPPDDDTILARITLSASLGDWQAMRPAIEPFFQIRYGHWHHQRIEAEMLARNRAQSAFRTGAEKTNKIRWVNSPSDSPSDTLPVSHTRSQIPEVIKNKTNKKPTNGFQLPDWIPEEQWNAWIEARVKIRKPATDYAKRVAVLKLDNLREQGHPPAQVLMQSAFNSWQGLFPPKEIK